MGRAVTSCSWQGERVSTRGSLPRHGDGLVPKQPSPPTQIFASVAVLLRQIISALSNPVHYGPWHAPSLCTMVPVHYGPCALWSLACTIPVHYGPCALWSLCTMVPVHYGP